MSHTPGPWKATSKNAGREFNKISIRPVTPCLKGSVLPIAYVARYELDEYGGGNGEANARLIASAPAMLEALERLIASDDAHATIHAPDGDDVARMLEYAAAFDNARAAIKAAKGES